MGRISDDYRDHVLDVIRDTPQHQYQVLTKRPEAMRDYFRDRPVPANFWAGATIESNRYVRRADILRDIDATVRFISAEPLLDGLPDFDLSGIHWLITGGESGLHLRDPDLRARRGLSAPDEHGKWQAMPDRIHGCVVSATRRTLPVSPSGISNGAGFARTAPAGRSTGAPGTRCRRSPAPGALRREHGDGDDRQHERTTDHGR